MKLELYREDLKFECRDVNCSRIRFEHLRHDAQAAVTLVGKGTFYEEDRRNYTVVYPLEEKQ